ncbi:MAG: 30S ribosome-binding factor RbfA [Verrucomicrobiae bacterium]|nr:30S ribosome-binding factor RbfA [Verrucomicrobiae bacterium]MCX7722057.1 30S ribosome-binding factor RbfA [Verrucomicrobiae bacterium]MDW7979175.1 30S ribosome-binding factor RbfA [Verrucomicrobiales bacterium]
MSTIRQQRVGELLKREIGEIIRRELPADQVGLITVNDVEVSGDLRYATVFTSILGTAEQQKAGLALLSRNRLRIQELVAKAVVLKNIPRLRFVFDDSIVRGNRVLQIIDELEKGGPGDKK